MDWNTIQQRIEMDDQEKWDLSVQSQNLSFAPSGALLVRRNGNHQKYNLSDFALTQLCQKLGIPAGYFKRLPGEIQAELANYDLAGLLAASFFIRGKGPAIRAVLSDRYVAYNNRQIIKAVEAAVQGGLTIRSFALEDRGMFLKLMAPILADTELQLKAGVMIGNSEVGYAQVTVEPFVFRLPCTNDLIVAEEVVFRHRHVHYSAKDFSEKVASGMEAALKLAEGAVSSAGLADQRPVDDPGEEIQQLGRSWRIGRDVIADALAAFEAEPRPTRWGVANSFTRAAQQLGPMERIEVERLAGRLLAA